jgi:hypothetical protein
MSPTASGMYERVSGKSRRPSGMYGTAAGISRRLYGK